MRIDIHHIGVVVKKIENHIKRFWPFLSECDIGPIIEDPLQKVRVCFVEVNGTRIELVEPSDLESPVSAFIKKKPAGYHHICIEIESIEAFLERHSKEVVIASHAKPAVAFGGKRIAFVLTRDTLLWELLEVGPKTGY